MDFFGDLKIIVTNELTRLGIQYDSMADVQDLLLLICNHKFKNITPIKRKVHTSAEFDAELLNLTPVQQAAALAIKQKFNQGDDVSGHLSRGSGTDKAGDVDQLLADWGIYHLHISNHKNKPNDNFFARTGPVMFAHITDTDAYFIDIHPHGGWTRQKLLEIVERSWPHLYASSRCTGVTGVSMVPTDADIKTLRGSAKKNSFGSKSTKRPSGSVNAVLQVGNSFLMPPGGGLATDGTPFVNVFHSNKMLHLVQELERWATQNALKLKSDISTKFGVPVADLDFELVPLASGFGIREKNTGLMCLNRGATNDQTK